MTALVLLTVAIVLLVIDAWQTRYIAMHPESHSEMNIILGRHPSVSAVYLYFAVCIALSVAAAWWLLGRDQDVYVIVGAGAGIALEGWCVVHNWRRGIPFVQTSAR